VLAANDVDSVNDICFESYDQSCRLSKPKLMILRFYPNIHVSQSNIQFFFYSSTLPLHRLLQLTVDSHGCRNFLPRKCELQMALPPLYIFSVQFPVFSWCW